MAYERNPSRDLIWDPAQGKYVFVNVTLTILPTPADANVTLTATGYTQVGNTIAVLPNTPVTYTVSKMGYTPITDTIIVTQDTTLPITLTELFRFTINPTPADATVTLIAAGYTQYGNSIYVPINTDVAYTVVKDGYGTVSSIATVTQNTTLDIELLSIIVQEMSINGTVYDIFGKGILDQNGGTGYVYNWVGTLAEYNAQNIEVTHPDWVCLITDDNPGGDSVNIYTKPQIDAMLEAQQASVTNTLINLLESIYPVGTIYGGNMSSCPIAVVLPNSVWELLPANRALWTSNGTNAGTTIAAGLPNITGNVNGVSNRSFYATPTADGSFYVDNYANNQFAGGGGAGSNSALLHLDASRSSAVYGASDTVQPPAYVTNFWIRIA